LNIRVTFTDDNLFREFEFFKKIIGDNLSRVFFATKKKLVFCIIANFITDVLSLASDLYL